MNFEKKLSVIVMCYKHKEYITQCVDSVLSQKINYDMEVVIRDDGTNDGTYELLLEKYGNNPKVRILNSDKNLRDKNYETIKRNCVGEYIAYIDGDDYLIADNHYQDAINFLDANKNYVVYSGGYRYLENGAIHPQDGWMQSMKPDAELKDMLIENYVSLGRVYRNIEINVEFAKSLPYPDWAFLFELMKHGKSYSNPSYCCGIYRIHSSGVFSTTPMEEKLNNKQKMCEELTRLYNNFNKKVITIVDSFVYSENIRNKLKNAVEWMKNDGHEILLVSNTVIDQEILKNVKFYLYDHRNQLFKEKYDLVNVVDFWKTIGPNFVLHDIVPETQPHGLSVMINLFNALIYAKAQGYTHFQRFEVDDLFKEKSREYIKKIPELCEEQNKKGLFYYNANDISFHYFYCEIDTFLNKVPRIGCEQDYVDYLKKYHGNKVFKIVEVFVYENLKKNGDTELLIASGDDMNQHFPDTHWNTETSVSSFDKKYNGCTSKIYYINEYNKDTNSYERTNKYILFTYSYVSHLVKRTIRVKKSSGEVMEYYHNTHNAGGWCMNDLTEDTQSILVYENNELLYEENVADCISYINIKK